MAPTDPGLDTLTNRERAAVRALLVRATAAGCRGDGEVVERLARAAPVEALPDAAAVHRVAGSVLRGLDGVRSVTDDVRARLRAQCQHATLHHLLVSGLLGEIGTAFDDAGLAWVVMKGPVVATQLYPEVGDRSYGDLDLLVDRRHFPQAVRNLEDLGYQHVIRNWVLAEEMMAGEIQMIHHTVDVDLHWHFHYSRQDRLPFAIDPEELIERRRRVLVSGVTTPTLDAVDTLLTLAFHAARSDGHRLIWLKDVERSVAVEDPDLDELVRRCRAYRCAPPVGLILARARSLLGADIPPAIIRSLLPTPLRLADRALQALVDPVQLNERPTITRWFTRSVRSSVLTTLGAAPSRVARRVRRQLLPPPVNETDCPDEKESYLRAVAASIER